MTHHVPLPKDASSQRGTESHYVQLRRICLHSVEIRAWDRDTCPTPEEFAFTALSCDTLHPTPKDLPSQRGTVSPHVPRRRICLHSGGPCCTKSHAVWDRVTPCPTPNDLPSQRGTVSHHVPLQRICLHSVGSVGPLNPHHIPFDGFTPTVLNCNTHRCDVSSKELPCHGWTVTHTSRPIRRICLHMVGT